MTRVGRGFAILVGVGFVSIEPACSGAGDEDVSTDSAGSALGANVNSIDQKCKKGIWTCTESKPRHHAGVTARRVYAKFKTPNSEGHVGAKFIIKDDVVLAYAAYYGEPSRKRADDLDKLYGPGADDQKGRRSWTRADGSVAYRLSSRGSRLDVFSTKLAMDHHLVSAIESSNKLTHGGMVAKSPRTSFAKGGAPTSPIKVENKSYSYPLSLVSPTKWVSFEKGKVSQVSFVLKNEQLMPSAPAELLLDVPDFIGTPSGLKPLHLGAVSVPSIAAGESATIVFKLDKDLDARRYNAELLAVDSRVFADRKHSITVDVTPVGGWPIADLEVTKLTHELLPNQMMTSVPVTVTLKNVGHGQCTVSNPNCTIDGPVRVLLQATNADGSRVASESIELKHTAPIKWNETITLKGNMPFVSGYGFVSKLRAWVVEGGGRVAENDTRSVPFYVADSAFQAPVAPLYVSMELTQFKCSAQNESFWAWIGGSDEPFLYATGFIPQHGERTCGRGDNDICPIEEKREWSDVDVGDTRDVNVKWSATVNPGDITGFHISAWENDHGANIGDAVDLDPDDEIDFAYAHLNYSFLSSIADQGPKSYGFDLAGDGAEYNVTARVTVRRAPAELVLAKESAANVHRFGGTYDVDIDGFKSVIKLSAQAPFEQYPFGLLSGTWEGDSRKDTVRGLRLNGKLFEFEVTHLDANAKSQRFVGHLMGQAGQERIAGTTWYGGRAYGFSMMKRK